MKAEVNFDSSNNQLAISESKQELSAMGLDYHIGDFDYYHDHYIREFYPVYYPNYIVQRSTMEQAFKVMAKLIEKGYFKNITVQKFMTLINEISSVL